MRIGKVLHELVDLAERHVGEQAVRGDIQDDRLPPDHHGMVERLLENLHQAFAVIQGLAGIRVQIRAELGKDLEFAETRQVNAKGARSLFDGLGLGGAADTGDRQGRH